MPPCIPRLLEADRPLSTLRRDVTHDADRLEGDEPFRDKLVDCWQKGVDLLFRIHDLDHDRQVCRELEELRRMDSGVASEAHRAAENRRAGQVRFSRATHDRLVQRPVAARLLVALADKDAKQYAVFRYLQGSH